MKDTGILRYMDEFGRFTLPKEIRDILDIRPKDPLLFKVEGNTVMIKLHSQNCCICNGCFDIISYKGKRVCKDCIEDLRHEK